MVIRLLIDFVLTLEHHGIVELLNIVLISFKLYVVIVHEDLLLRVMEILGRFSHLEVIV